MLGRFKTSDLKKFVFLMAFLKSLPLRHLMVHLNLLQLTYEIHPYGYHRVWFYRSFSTLKSFCSSLTLFFKYKLSLNFIFLGVNMKNATANGVSYAN